MFTVSSSISHNAYIRMGIGQCHITTNKDYKSVRKRKNMPTYVSSLESPFLYFRTVVTQLITVYLPSPLFSNQRVARL